MKLDRFAWLVLAFNLLVILWGATVRATGSGAGCGGHWPLCNGEVVPRQPEVQTLIEYSHRLSSGLAFLLVLGLWIAVRRARPAGDPTRRAAAAAFGLMVLEAALGAGLVLFGLVGEDASLGRALVMPIHLINTFFLIAAIALTAHLAAGAPMPRWHGQGAAAGLLGAGAAAVLLTGVSGAVAALGDTLYPPEALDGAMASSLPPVTEALIQLRLLHPAIALLASALLAIAALRLPRLRPTPPVRRASLLLLALVAIELAVGLVNVLLLAPIALQLAHLLLADLLWISLVLLAAHALAAPEAAKAGLSAAAPAALAR